MMIVPLRCSCKKILAICYAVVTDIELGKYIPLFSLLYRVGLIKTIGWIPEYN